MAKEIQRGVERYSDGERDLDPWLLTFKVLVLLLPTSFFTFVRVN